MVTVCYKQVEWDDMSVGKRDRACMQCLSFCVIWSANRIGRKRMFDQAHKIANELRV
jgi:hypothetical protein